MSNPLQVPDRNNELLREADDYLRKHKILELFEVYKDRIIINSITIGLDNHYLL